MSNETNAAKLAAVYIKMRNKRAALAKAYEAADEELKTQMSIVTDAMLEICKATGADSVKTPNGTIIRSVKTRYWTSDWSQMYAFIKAHDAPDLLEQRIHQTHMKDWIADHPDTLPQALQQNAEYVISVRKPK